MVWLWLPFYRQANCGPERFRNWEDITQLKSGRVNYLLLVLLKCQQSEEAATLLACLKTPKATWQNHERPVTSLSHVSRKLGRRMLSDAGRTQGPCATQAAGKLLTLHTRAAGKDTQDPCRRVEPEAKASTLNLNGSRWQREGGSPG